LPRYTASGVPAPAVLGGWMHRAFELSSLTQKPWKLPIDDALAQYLVELQSEVCLESAEVMLLKTATSRNRVPALQRSVMLRKKPKRGSEGV
jgi:hypothetical protein